LRHVEPYLLNLFNSEHYRRWVDQFHEQKRLHVVKFTLIDIYRKRSISPNDSIWFFHGYGTSFDRETNQRNNNTWALCSEDKDAILVVINVIMSENIRGNNINKFILLFENQSFVTGGYRIEAFTSYRYTPNIETPNTDELEKVLGIKFGKNDNRLKKMIGSKSWSNPSLCSEIIHQWWLELDFTEKEYLNMCSRCDKMRKTKEMCVRIFDWDNIDIILNEIGDYKASDMVRRYRFMKQTEKIEMNIYDDTDYYNVLIRNPTTIFEPSDNNRV
jgi:hypothetical protein